MILDIVFIPMLVGYVYLTQYACANDDARRLYEDLFHPRAYNRLIRPRCEDSTLLTIKLGLRLSHIVEVVRANGPGVLQILIIFHFIFIQQK